MSPFTIRFAAPPDAAALLALETTHFPAVSGQPHAGYTFSAPKLTAFVLDEAVAAPKGVLTLVAEVDGAVVGFAATGPWSFPGFGPRQFDPTTLLLQYLAVEPDHQRQGIGSALVAEIERRGAAAGRDMVVAHVPEDAAFYDAASWHVAPIDHGTAWLPTGSHLRADVGDPALGFPRVSTKVLHPSAIRHTFDFRIRKGGGPIANAATELSSLIDSGEVDPKHLDSDTKGMIRIAKITAAPRSAFGAVRDSFGRPRRQ